MPWRAQPTRRFLVATFAFTAVTALALRWLLSFDGALSWLAAINLAAAVLYVYDKSISDSGRLRVPETVLLFAALVGGTPAAYVSMRLVRHKTSKRAFQRRFQLIVIGQVLATALYFLLIRPRINGAA